MLWSVAVSRRPPNVMIGVRHAKYMKKNEARHCTCKESLKSLKYHGVLRRTSLRNPPNSLHNKTHSTSGEQYTYIITKSHQINNTINFSLNSKVCLTYWPLSSHSKLLWRYATVQSWIILKVALQSTPVHCLWYVRNVYRRISSNQNKRIIYRRPLQWMWLIQVLEALAPASTSQRRISMLLLFCSHMSWCRLLHDWCHLTIWRLQWIWLLALLLCKQHRQYMPRCRQLLILHYNTCVQLTQ